MRVILGLGLVLAVLWGGYWFVGSTVVERGTAQVFADQAAAGLTATQDGIAVAGFPSRFDLTVTTPHLADPATGWGWRAPFAQVLSMTWKPWHVIAVLPPDQVIEAPGQTIALTTSRMVGSLRLAPSTDLTLKEVIAEGHDLVFKSDLGWQVGVASAVLALAEDPAQPFAQRLGLTITDLSPDPHLVAQVPELGELVKVIHLDASLQMTAALDRHAGTVPPALTAVTVRDLRVEWGSLLLTATGQLTPGPDGFATGKIDFRIENWRQIPALLVAAGVVLPAAGDSIARGIEVLARSGPDPDVLDLALTLQDGRMDLGPLPLGPAPLWN